MSSTPRREGHGALLTSESVHDRYFENKARAISQLQKESRPEVNVVKHYRWCFKEGTGRQHATTTFLEKTTTGAPDLGLWESGVDRIEIPGSLYSSNASPARADAHEPPHS